MSSKYGYAFEMLDRGILSKFGRCGRCVRKAFFFACCSWCGTLMVAVFAFPRIHAFAFCSVALSCPFVAHAIAFVARSRSPSRGGGSLSSRRLALLFSLRALAVVVLICSRSEKALARSPCGGWEGECEPCERRYSPDSPCLPCGTCGPECPPSTTDAKC